MTPTTRTLARNHQARCRKGGLNSIRTLLVILVLCLTVPSFLVMGWIKVSAEMQTAEAQTNDHLNATLNHGLLIMGGIAAACAALAVFIGYRYLALPLEKFLESGKRFVSGDLKTRSGIDYQCGELGRLARIFDEMADIFEVQSELQLKAKNDLAEYAHRLGELVLERTHELEDSQKRTHLILDSTTEGIIELDMQRHITFANRASLRILGKTERELVQFPLFKSLSSKGELLEAHDGTLMKELEEKGEVHLRNCLYLKEQDKPLPVDVHIAPVVRDGEQTGHVVVLSDQSESFEMHETMAAVYRSTVNGYITFSENLEILDCNPTLERLLKASKADILRNYTRYSPTFQPGGVLSACKHRELLEQALNGGYSSTPWLLLDSSKELLPCIIKMDLVESPRRRFVLCSVQDQRERIKAEEARNAQREQLQNILDSSPIILAVTDNTSVLSVNENGFNLLGIREGDAVSSFYAEPSGSSYVLEVMGLDKSLDNWPVKLKSTTGKIFDVLLSLRPFIYEKRKAFLTWIVDVTDLTRARQDAEEGTRAKSDFLARMSHEIRTPMNAILGMSHLCLMTPLTSKQHHYLDKIHSSALSLLTLINDILDFSKIEAGKLTFEHIPFRLSQVLQNLEDLIAFKAEDKGLLFLTSIASDVPEYVVGDPLRLGQVLLNLCQNAINFTESGCISVRVCLENPSQAAETHDTHLHFTVKDTGIGMTPEQTARLFSPFTQGDNSITRRYGGTGLGLVICKNLIESMGGEISIQSQPQQGTLVTFTLDLPVCENLPVGSDGEQENDSFRSKVYPPLHGEVLLVEDNPTNQEVALALLEQRGLRADIAENGQEALDSVAKKNYDLILMDIQMPVMDGLEAARRIRELPGHDRKALPIVAFTAHALEDDYQKSMEWGMNSHITKPIDPKLFYRELERWLPLAESIAPETEDDQPHRSLPKALFAVPGLSVEQGLLHLDGNADLYASLLGKFPEQYGQTAAQIAKMRRKGATEQAQRAAHSIKSVAGSLGMEELFGYARNLENSFAEEDFHQETFDNFALCLKKLTQALKKIFAAPKEERPSSRPLPELDLNALDRVVESLPEWLDQDLMKAWGELSRLETVFAETACTREFSELSRAVRDCDKEKIKEAGKALLDVLKAK